MHIGSKLVKTSIPSEVLANFILNPLTPLGHDAVFSNLDKNLPLYRVKSSPLSIVTPIVFPLPINLANSLIYLVLLSVQPMLVYVKLLTGPLNSNGVPLSTPTHPLSTSPHFRHNLFIEVSALP